MDGINNGKCGQKANLGYFGLISDQGGCFLEVNIPPIHFIGDSDEAEYAWLPVDCMKPFGPGDETGNPDGSISTDVTLQECVGAADRAVAEIERRLASADADMAGDGDNTDSDGGMLLHSNAERCRRQNAILK